MVASSPLLIVIAGVGRGRTVPIQSRVTIGRGDDNVLAIPDPALSRQHCLVEVADEGFVIRDLTSKNGVFVNGCPVNQRTLTDGDQIRIGDSALLLVMPRGAFSAADQVSVSVVDTPVPFASTVVVDAVTNGYVGSAVARPAERAVDDLRVLLELSEALHTANSREALTDLVLTQTLDACRADLTALVTHADDRGTGIEIVSARQRLAGSAGSINRVLAARALAGRSAILTRDEPAMCAPLVSVGGASTALFVAREPRAGRAFAERDLHLLAAIGALAGPAFDRVGQVEWLAGENRRLQTDLTIDHNLIGDSPPMQAVYRFIARVAATDSTVLLRGESGTGKELVASAIHRNSRRSAKPLVAINCAALPDALLESELFGHERGAFTGAVAQQRGRLEMADGGTIFLDEIGELAPALQAKLLRVLQDQIVERVGGRKPIKIDVRVIAATNRDLDAAIKAGRFREDLYYRLNVVSLTMPALRDRRDDLPLLAAYFVRQHASRCKRNVRGLAAAAKRRLMAYDWPGNVRELSNAIERAVVLGSSDIISDEDLPETLLDATEPDDDSGFHAMVTRAKREIIREALERSGGSVAQAARDLGLQTTYLHRLIRTLAVKAPLRTPPS